MGSADAICLTSLGAVDIRSISAKWVVKAYEARRERDYRFVINDLCTLCMLNDEALVLRRLMLTEMESCFVWKQEG